MQTLHPANFKCAPEPRAAKAAAQTQLIARAQRGEKAAFNGIFSAHKRRVYSLCLAMTRDATEAEDLTQDSFLQVFLKIKTFRGESAFSTWLHRLVVNVVLMRLRRKHFQYVPLDENGAMREEAVRHEYLSVDRRLIGSIDRIALGRAIARLPMGYRVVFILHDVEGYGHNEIAEIMNCAVGTSKSQLHRARLRLRESLLQDYGRRYLRSA